MAGQIAREYEQISLDENSEIEDDAFLSYFSKRDTSQSESDFNVSASESGTDFGESYLIDDGPTSATSSTTASTGTAGGETRGRCRSGMISTEAAHLEMSSPSPSRRQGFTLAGYQGHPYFTSLDSNEDDSGNVCGGDSSMIEGLLCEIYDRVHVTPHNYKVDSDGFTECSSNSDGAYLSSKGDSFQESTRLPKALLNTKEIPELLEMVRDLQKGVAIFNGRLVKLLKRRDRYLAKQQKNQDVLTAILQAVSQKRRIDARLKFSIEPLPGKKAFRQWYDALRAVARLPQGIPPQFRKKFWLSLANRHVQHLKLDWSKTVRFAFNDRSNPDDDKLGVQIVKDLHRTGCTGFCGTDAEEDRVVLKRVLLAYARWNKSVGYCQGFNVIAALILEIMEHVEDEALKLMIFLIDHVLPDSYFANNLRALSVDMAVFRELLHFKLPDLAQHLDKLQKDANDGVSGNYEPPLTNVFTMQWFLTLFATCLPKPLVLRVWDCIFLEGSEVLLRVALAIWAKLGDKLAEVNSSDEFYGCMGAMCNEMLTKSIIDGDDLIQTIYSMAPFPFPHLNEIREKYMFSITPFSPLGSLDDSSDVEGISPKGNKVKSTSGDRPPSDEDNEVDDEEDFGALTCFVGLLPTPVSPTRSKPPIGHGEWAAKGRSSSADITGVSPGAFAANSEAENQHKPQTAMLERMNLDVYSLKKQYWRIQRRQQQAHVIYGAAGTKEESRGRRLRHHSRTLAAPIDNPAAINHLLIGKHGLGRKNKKSAIVSPQVSKGRTNQGGSPSNSSVTGSPPQSLPSSLPSVAPPGSPDTMSLMSSYGGSTGTLDGSTGDIKTLLSGIKIDGVVEGKVYHYDDSDSDHVANEDSESQLTNDSQINSSGLNASISSDGSHTPTEPAIGLLIDMEDSADHVDSPGGSAGSPAQLSLGKREEGDGVSPSAQSDEETTAPFTTSSVHDILRQSSDNEVTTPEDSITSSDSIMMSSHEYSKMNSHEYSDSPAQGDVGYSPARQFNMSIDAYTPSLQGLEGTSNPKLDGQSMKKPWQKWDSDSDDDFWNDDDDDASPMSARSDSASYGRSTHKHHKPKTPPPKTVFNPFPRRKLKSEENRTRKGLKVGLYKMPAQGQGQNQQMDHPVQRMVKLGW